MFDWLMHYELLFLLFVVLSRIADVSLGTMRTISVVRGYPTLAAVLGFCELIIWVAAVSGVLTEPTVGRVLAYATGFSLGNVCGMMLEKRVALGEQLLMIISRERSPAMAFALRIAGYTVTEVPARGGGGEVALTLLIVPRRKMAHALALAREVDPDAFTTFNDVRSSSLIRRVTKTEPTGWRALIKKK